ncbi:MAG: glycosyltransferase family 4 protein [Chitinophagaceae bacterium]
MEKHLHIVCLDVPYPVDYGGVFDLFYKITALKELGVFIHLHCFEYGRGKQPELEKYCVEVLYYSRRKGHKGFSLKVPYIVSSRINEDLYTRLLQDDYPIFLEGIHCSHLLLNNKFENRKLFLRIHNTEYLYYRQLAKSETNIFKKMYYLHESSLLMNYEKSIARRATLLTVSEQDAAIYRNGFNATRILNLPAFLPFTNIQSETGIGCYCLYHGNLSVAENEKAAIWLLKEVFNNMKVPFVIAGKNPSTRLKNLAHEQPNTCLVANPSGEELQDMISKAQINIIPSFNSTGIKLKLLNVLYNGRHCVVNEATTRGSGLEAACHTASNATAIKNIIAQLYHQPFGEEEITLRKTLLEAGFNNNRNAQLLIKWIW